MLQSELNAPPSDMIETEDQSLILALRSPKLAILWVQKAAIAREAA
jgi:hypothetical protein